MTAPNIPNTPRILGIEESIREELEAVEPTVVVTDSTFGESLTARAGGHTVYFRGHDFHISNFSLAPNGHGHLYYNASHYSINVLEEMYVTFIGDSVVFVGGSVVVIGDGVEFTDAA